MELRQLEHFVAVAAERSFTRGAARAHVVQSALSASVAKLEKELGVALVDRSRRQIVLSAAGEAFLEHAYEVLSAANRAKSAAAGYAGQLAGTVEVGTLMSSGALDLPAALGRFHRLHPLVNVRLRQSAAGSAGHVADVADGRLDLALVSTPGMPTPLVDVRELSREPMMFVCSPEHPLAGKTRIRLTDLVGQHLVQFAPGWGVRRVLDQGLAAAGLEVTTAYEVADYATAAGLARNQLGVTVLPAPEARRFTELRHIPMSPTLTWTLCLATAPARHLSPAAAGLAAELVNEAAAQTR